jgi:malate dehydrogenase (quinone)
MLGASPGASTAAWIMLQVIERCFRQNLATEGWTNKLREMIPSYGQSLIENPALVQRLRAETAAILHLNNINTKEKQNDSRVSAVHGD